MVAKMGRPVIDDSPKTYMLRVRMSDEDLQQLDACCKVFELTRSEMVRMWIKQQYAKIKK